MPPKKKNTTESPAAKRKREKKEQEEAEAAQEQQNEAEEQAKAIAAELKKNKEKEARAKAKKKAEELAKQKEAEELAKESDEDEENDDEIQRKHRIAKRNRNKDYLVSKELLRKDLGDRFKYLPEEIAGMGTGDFDWTADRPTTQPGLTVWIFYKALKHCSYKGLEAIVIDSNGVSYMLYKALYYIVLTYIETY